MKKSQLRQIIKEEISKVLKEEMRDRSTGDVSTDRTAFINSRTPVSPKTNELMSFIKNNSEEVAAQVGNTITDIDIDEEGDVGARDIDGFGGFAFRYPEDVDDEFVGEDGDSPRPIEVAGRKLLYIAYNI